MYDVRIERLEQMALFDLKGSRSVIEGWCGHTLPDFPDTPLSYNVKDNLELMFLGPEHWILRAPLNMEKALGEVFRPEKAPDEISIVCISDTLAFFSMSGSEILELMSVVSPLDTNLDVFHVNSSLFSEAFLVKALFVRVGDAIQLGVDRSFGPMIADYLARSVAD